MKKIITLCLQLLIVISFFSSLDVYTQTDSYIDIGSARIRFDADSNKIRFGKRPVTGIGNLKLAKEFNGALFDFKNTHFLWSTTDGLTLQDPLSHDSVWAHVFAVTRDTGTASLYLYSADYFHLRKDFGEMARHYGITFYGIITHIICWECWQHMIRQVLSMTVL